MASLRLPAVLVVAIGAALLAPAPADGAVTITTSPRLKPRFDRGSPDYVVRCNPGTPVRFAVSASDGDTVAVGNGAKRGGDFTADASLEPGAAVELRVSSAGRSSTHHVRCLPLDFPTWTVHRRRKPQSQWYVLTPVGRYSAGYVAVFDARGVPVWWMHSSWYAPWDGKLMRSGNLMWSRIFGTDFGLDPRGGWEEHRLDGRIVRTLQTKGTPILYLDRPDGVGEDRQRRTLDFAQRLNRRHSEHTPAAAAELDARIAAYELAFKMQSAAPESESGPATKERRGAKLAKDRGILPDKVNGLARIDMATGEIQRWHESHVPTNGAVVATAMAGYDGHRAWVYYLGVDPGHLRRGYGRRLLDEVERLLRPLGCPKINLQVRNTNHEVIAFYQRIGYAIDEVTSLGKRLERDDAAPT